MRLATCVLVLLPCCGNAASLQEAQSRFDAYRRAAVKVRVVGTNPDGQAVRREGSGFYIYSKAGRSFIVTARHVVGSSETEQSKNRDWYVQADGRLDRKIAVESLDEQGSLVVRDRDALVAPTYLPANVDLELLMIGKGDFPVIPLANQMEDKINLHDVILIGFRHDKDDLTKPIPVGHGQLELLTYKLDVASHRGESGGAWIDIDSGRVFAVARGARTSPDDPSTEATPVTLIKPSLTAYFQSAGLNIDPSPPGGSERFRILAADGHATVAIGGDTGTLAARSGKQVQLSQLASLLGTGAEASQCDAGSGRTISQASASAQVTPFEMAGLRFEYTLLARGGHYRTAVTCFGGNPVGLTGHDTTSSAQATLKGTLDFYVSGAPVALTWKTMPAGQIRILSESGSMVQSKEIAESGEWILTDLAPGRYRLDANLVELLQQRGASFGEAAGNGIIKLDAILGSRQ